ncbi:MULTISPECIES: EamA family transporter RarD [unclassified Lysinibacillus]|uniref:EamA family transporter RarD n=1 Tax=unclassified Lysinibacillus TaxID=2636778 RepID=UPI001167CB54|nr:EamA family transporter RarD [Lysinibacillus sp. CD3-6]QPQ36172.1 EamA family transporter RarD [Lysinibacillus sp. JNUCC-52]UED82169.1 EamA family transporter RarD [Lysinibacillus sp. CD3-6]
MSNEKKGVLAAFFAYAIWGAFPLYWKLLEHVPSMEILLGRVIWSFVFTVLAVIILGMRKELLADLKYLWTHQKIFWQLAGASFVISMNWYLYIWAVTHEHLIETSLGYYINPLLSVIFGVVFFKESLSRAQWVATAIAFIAVIILTVNYGTVPWVAILIALTFAIYGVLKKKITLDATRGLAIETMFILPFALGYYIYLFSTSQASFLHVNIHTDVLMIVSGIVTAVPLVLFAKGAQNIPLYLLGFIQYVAPTIVLILGVVLYKEPFSQVELLAFSIIWLALLLFSGSKIIEIRKAHHKSA